MPVTNLAELDALVARVKAAQAEFATFSQEQVDKIFRAASLAANQARIPLAQMAVEESGMGIVEDKVNQKPLCLLSLSTTSTKTKKPVASSKKMTT